MMKSERKNENIKEIEVYILDHQIESTKDEEQKDGTKDI